jgi:hypothetical protein
MQKIGVSVFVPDILMLRIRDKLAKQLPFRIEQR